MKIALMIPGSLDTMSGGYLYDRNLVAGLRERGEVVDVVPLGSRGYVYDLTHSPCVRLPSDYDILLQDELAHPSLILANQRRRKHPVVALVHNLHSEEHRAAWKNRVFRAAEAKYLASVDGFVFNSAATEASVRRLRRSLPSHVIATPGGDRLGALDADVVQERAAHGGPLALLFLGNVIPGKGLDVLLRALEQLPGSDFVLAVVGSCDVDPVYAARMRQKAGRLRQHVVFHGILDGAALSEQLRSAQALILPSYYEGFGIAFLEGMAHGLPAIGARAGGVPDLIFDGVNGFVVQPGNSDALARRLEELSRDRGLLATLGLGALREFKSRPTWQQSADSVRVFLTDMVQKWRSSSREGQREGSGAER